ncbi:MAG TPA: peptidase inhibitor family I36 protein [Terriglobia bacterium]|nr:peptidase inhibitor family I36 protein [Terriglobia bacterium]
MRKLTIILGLLTGIFSVASMTTAAQVRSTNSRVCFYEHSHFGGWQQCYGPGEELADLGNYRNKISSVRVYGDARVTLFANKNFEGASLEVTSDLNDLAQHKIPGGIGTFTWNDVTESARVTGRAVTRTSPPPAPVYRDDDRQAQIDSRDVYRDNRRSNSNNYVCIYEDIDYRGRYECFDTGDEVSDFGRWSGWNDRISSIRVHGVARVTLYRDINFRGDRITIDRNVYDLRRLRMTSSMSWDNQASSLDINGGRGRAYGRNSRY